MRITNLTRGLCTYLLALFPLASFSDQFKNNSKYFERQATNEKEDPRFVIGNLSLNEKIVISTRMITENTDQVIPLGTFCAYQKGHNPFPLRITTNENGFIAKGLNGQGNLPYHILVNKVELNYNQKQMIQTNNYAFDECQLYENLAIKFSKYTIQNAKAGRYELSLILQST
ncbi:hypothetical protein [Caedibacter taeniospiralis]|jgi:hypothetical protein|uniref:hypothetical protein n=1 Tax=Caedibacter taeniospiralis TaxID=28907 RepID=UPI0037C0DE32